MGAVGICPHLVLVNALTLCIPIRGVVYTQQILETFKFENVPPGLTVRKKNSLDFEKESFFAHSLTKTHCSNIINLYSIFGFQLEFDDFSFDP